MKKIRKKLYALKEEEGIEFVHGYGKRKSQLQRSIETLEDLGFRRYAYRGIENVTAWPSALFQQERLQEKHENKAILMKMRAKRASAVTILSFFLK